MCSSFVTGTLEGALRKQVVVFLLYQIKAPPHTHTQCSVSNSGQAKLVFLAVQKLSKNLTAVPCSVPLSTSIQQVGLDFGWRFSNCGINRSALILNIHYTQKKQCKLSDPSQSSLSELHNHIIQLQTSTD